MTDIYEPMQPFKLIRKRRSVNRGGERKVVAEQAESYVCQMLRQRNWSIAARNFRHIGTEIDIIATKQQRLMMVEVKLRNFPAQHLYQIENLLPFHKKLALQRGLNCWLSRSHKSYTSMTSWIAVVGYSKVPDAPDVPEFKLTYFRQIPKI